MSASNADFDASPEPFRGTRSQVGTFLAQLDEEFQAQPDVFSSDHAKVSHFPPILTDPHYGPAGCLAMYVS